MSDPRQEIRDMIFAMEILRQVGFESDQMLSMLGNAEGIGPACFVRLEAQDKTFDWVIARAPRIPNEAFVREWNSAIAEWNLHRGVETNTWGFQESGIRDMAVGVMAALQEKGFRMPCAMS